MRLTANKLSRLQLTGIIIATAIVLAFMGVAYYYNEKQQVEDKHYNILKSVAELKADQVAHWYTDIIAEATYYSSDLPVSFTANENGRDIKLDYSRLSSSLQKVMHDHQYENIMLTDTGGRLLFSVEEFYKIGGSTIKCIRDIAKSGQVSVTDLYYCQDHQKVHFDIVIPLFFNKNATASVNDVAAFLIFRVDPDDYLFPLINAWPGDNKTAETVLGRISGNSVVLLNKKAAETNHPKEFRLNENNQDLPTRTGCKRQNRPLYGS